MFTRAAAVGDGRTGTITDGTWSRVAIRLVPGPGRDSFPGGPEPEARSAGAGAGAVPRELTAAGGSFAVDWRAPAASAVGATATRKPG